MLYLGLDTVYLTNECKKGYAIFIEFVVLNLSKNSQLNIVNAGKESFLIVCSKNSQAAVVPLNSEKFATNLEGYSDETE